MGKKSTKENKTKYHLAREELGWSREYASEQLGMITPERLERIESEKVTPDPKEILAMAETYGRPSLCNYYCSQKCPIGQQYVPEIEVKELSSIVLEMLASLNSVNKRKDRLKVVKSLMTACALERFVSSSSVAFVSDKVLLASSATNRY